MVVQEMVEVIYHDFHTITISVPEPLRGHLVLAKFTIFSSPVQLQDIIHNIISFKRNL